MHSLFKLSVKAAAKACMFKTELGKLIYESQKMKIRKLLTRQEQLLNLGKYEHRYKNGQLKSSEIYNEGRRIYFEWRENGNIHRIINYYEDILHGKDSIYDKDGILVGEINYKKGKLHGKSYYRSNYIQVCYYIDGELDGPYITYNLSNELISHKYYINGEPHGEHLFYSDGKIIEKLVYYYGSLIHKYILHNNGNPCEISHYKNGRLHGRREKYYIDGNIKEICNYRRDYFHGERIKISGNVKKISNFHYGDPHGYFRKYVNEELVKEKYYEYGSLVSNHD